MAWSRMESADPNVVIPYNDIDEPNRMHERKLNVDPRLKKSNELKTEPIRETPYNDIAEPTRPIDRMEKLEPQCKWSNTDMLDPQ